MNKKPKILVVGSFIMDLVATADRVPNMGETVIGNSFKTAPGGKGANQAVAVARLQGWELKPIWQAVSETTCTDRLCFRP